jgi:hypothetical protein
MTQRNHEGPDPGGPPFREMRQQMQVLIGVMQIVAMPLSAHTRRLGTWGDRYVGFHMALGWLSMPAFALFFPEADVRPLLLAWLTTGILLAAHRVCGWWRTLRGYWAPSQYSGGSWIPGDEWKAKGHWEPFLALLLGMAACLYSPVVGTWLIAAAACQAVVVALAQDEEKAIVRAARDARFRAQYEMDLLRKELGEQ